MRQRVSRAAEEDTWSKLGSAAVDRGDFATARTYFEKAVDARPRSAICRFHLALVLEALTEPGLAAEQLTEALRLEPTMIDAARRLGALIARRSLPGNVKLNPRGIQAALNFPFVNRDQIAEAFVYAMARVDPLKSALAVGRTSGWIEAARALCVRKTSPLLADNLFCLALANNIIRMPELERLLTALRKVLLLEVRSERFQDRALSAFVVALAQQCWINEYVWLVEEDEEAALQERFAGKDLTGIDPACGLELALAAMYGPISRWIDPNVDVGEIGKMRPHATRDLVLQQLGHGRIEKERADRIESLRPVTDPTSQTVKSQYEASPYPRWTSLGILTTEGEWRMLLQQFFGSDRLAFMDRPFEVLIAGCGTGLQAIAASIVYGRNAHVTAIDISKPSLGYAARMAEQLGVQNIRFMQADILDLEDAPKFKGSFDIIECVGVLHHLFDPFRGWRSLLACLKPDGIMLLGLYSKLGRRFLAEFRASADHPGPNCSDKELRAYRQALMGPGGKLPEELFGIRDLYSTSSFRDLILHVNEHNLTLREIAAFMHGNGVVFRGFSNLQDFPRLKATFANAEWPGELQQWAEFEQRQPNLFGDMYRFWCDRSR